MAATFLGAGVGGNRKLEGIAAQIDWQPIARLIDALRPDHTGRPPYAPLAMVRVLLLQRKRLAARPRSRACARTTTSGDARHEPEPQSGENDRSYDRS